MFVRDVLAGKGNAVATISGSATAVDLVALLAERRIGAAVVTVDGVHIDGIVSERDVARGLHAHGAALLTMPVADLMTTDVLTCVPDDRVEDIARVMTERRVRHLPVVVDGALSGIVSIGDIVKRRIDELESETDHLTNYLFAR